MKIRKTTCITHYFCETIKYKSGVANTNLRVQITKKHAAAAKLGS